MFFQKFDPRAAYFTYIMQRINDVGLLDYFYTMTIPYKDIKVPESVEEEALILEYMLVPISCLCIGLATGLLTFSAEKVLHRLEGTTNSSLYEKHWAIDRNRENDSFYKMKSLNDGSMIS